MFKFNQKGFTLLELLVTIFVIAIGLIAAYKVASYPLSQVSVSMNRLTAAYLAQEGIEIVRNIRDTNWIEGNSWDDGLIDKCTSSNNKFCYPDYNDTELTQQIAGNPPPLKFDGQFYTNDSGSDTRFTRKITIDKESDVLKVKVIVEWEEKGKLYGFNLQENLYNYWKED